MKPNFSCLFFQRTKDMIDFFHVIEGIVIYEFNLRHIFQIRLRPNFMADKSFGLFQSQHGGFALLFIPGDGLKRSYISIDFKSVADDMRPAVAFDQADHFGKGLIEQLAFIRHHG